MSLDWQNSIKLSPKSYKCGYCGESIASEKGWIGYIQPLGVVFGSVYICHSCGKPTFFNQEGLQTPGCIFGNKVNGITDKMVDELYEEARKCASSNSFTAVVLCCRKLLMHIAVSKGAPDGLKFIEYVEYLSDNNYVPPDAKYWVDHIRNKGNEANHEIMIMDKQTAEDLLSFIEMLLKIIYEFPSIVRSRIPPQPAANTT